MGRVIKDGDNVQKSDEPEDFSLMSINVIKSHYKPFFFIFGKLYEP
jgi:hypothetical protein